MKNLNIIFKVIIITSISQGNLVPGFAGRAAQEASEANLANVREGITTTFQAPTGTGTNQNCPPCVSQTSNYIAPFYIQILAGTSRSSVTVLNQETSTYGMLMLQGSTGPNTNFQYSNTMLTVHIFPPSNIIKTGPTPQYTNDKKYLAFYTLKDLSGNVVARAFEQFAATDFPHYIGIVGTKTTAPNNQQTPSQSGQTSSPTPATFPTDGGNQNYACLGEFFPHNVGSNAADKQKVINGISPIVQNFLFNINNGSLSITHISGAFGSSSGLSMKMTPSSSFSAVSATAGSDNLLPLNITFNNTGQSPSPVTTMTFDINDTKPQVQFTQQDIDNGLMLNVVIFPTSSSNYSVIATLRTIDGTKLRKKYSINSLPVGPNAQLLTTMPQSISLTQGDPSSSPTNILTTNILSQAINAMGSNAQYLFNIISPINLGFILTKPTGSQTIQALMI